MPGVVAMSGIVPAAISLPLPFNTGSKIPLGVVRTIFRFERVSNSQPFEGLRKGLSRFNAVEDKEVCTQQSVLEFLNRRNVICRTVFAVAEANANVADYRSVPGAQLAYLRKLLGEVRLNDNNVGLFTVFNPRLYSRRWVEHQVDLIMCLLAIKIDDFCQRRLKGAIAHDLNVGSLSTGSECREDGCEHSAQSDVFGLCAHGT